MAALAGGIGYQWQAGGCQLLQNLLGASARVSASAGSHQPKRLDKGDATDLLVHIALSIKLQHNPLLMHVLAMWQVYSAIKVVLAEFARTPMTVAAGSLGGGAGAAADSDGLTVKYLSSSKLMHLQLRDAGLRRHFLVQALTLLQACSRKATAKQDTLKIKQVRMLVRPRMQSPSVLLSLLVVSSVCPDW